MSLDALLSLPTFATVITGLLFAGALSPKLHQGEKILRFHWPWQGSLILVGLASLYALLFSGWFFWSHPMALDHAVWFSSAWAPQGLPPLQWELGLDALAAFFLFLMAGFALLVTIYSFGALKAEHYAKYRHVIPGAYSLFVWGSMMAILAYDVFSLLVILEIATLAFAALSLFKMNVYRSGVLEGEEVQRREARLAPKVYLIISHASSAFLLLGFLILAVPAQSLSFQTLIVQAARGGLTSFQNQTAFWLLLLGLGIRAGLLPAHIWPPLVHPASPTTTHAFSLGMGIKVAIFLMIRVFFQLLQPDPWWGLVIFILAGMTALINVWYALASHDLKTALAYHSIENIGIIVAAVGLGLYAWAYGPDSPLAPLAGLALVAGLLHLLNHAIFKSLLYLATGAIENLTHGEVRMAHLGGVLNRFPWTGAFFLAGAWAIAGLPPFNGFVSEWLTLKANLNIFSAYIFHSPSNNILWRELLFILFGFLLLVTSFALTAFCFYKIAGLTLLGPRRHPQASWDDARDASVWMLAPMAFLAGSALLIGLFPGPFLGKLARILTTLGVEDVFTPAEAPVSWSIPERAWPLWSAHVWLGLVAMIALGLLFVMLYFHLRHARKKRLAWQGGVKELSPTMAHPTGAALIWWIARKQLRYLNHEIFARHAIASDRDYLPAVFQLADAPQPQARQVVVEVFRYIYNYLIHKVFTFSEQFALIVQNGDVRRYVGYIAFTYLLTLILYMIFVYTLTNG